jgi:hypothetical protein
MDDIKQVVIWGHKLHSHTHSYIHNAFFIAFKHLGYKTIWLDENDNISNIDFSNTLFLTEGSTDTNIPIRNDCYYVLHNCECNKYNILEKKRVLIIQVFTTDVFFGRTIEKIDDFIYYTPIINNQYSILYMPWATDLLPEQIQNNIDEYDIKIKPKFVLNFVGMMTNEWEIVKVFCKKTNIQFKNVGGFSQNVEISENQKLIQESLIAPSIQTKWQCEKGYIPCRIFKNISYGKMGITNNKYVSKLFSNKIIYDDNIFNALTKRLFFEKNNFQLKKSIVINQMQYIKEKHTYLNRINIILSLLFKQNN